MKTHSMSAIQIQEKLKSYIKTGDLRLLKLLYAVAKEYTDESLIMPGKPMTSKELRTRVKASKERVKRGEFTTQEDLEKEMTEW